MSNPHNFEASADIPQTNIPFLFRLLTHDVFIGGKTWTTVSDLSCNIHAANKIRLLQFIDDTPELFKLVLSQNRAQKLLAYLGDLAVNGSSIKGQTVECFRVFVMLLLTRVLRVNQVSRRISLYQHSRTEKTPKTDLLSMLHSHVNRDGEISSSRKVLKHLPRLYATTLVFLSWTQHGEMPISPFLRPG